MSEASGALLEDCRWFAVVDRKQSIHTLAHIYAHADIHTEVLAHRARTQDGTCIEYLYRSTYDDSYCVCLADVLHRLSYVFCLSCIVDSGCI